MKKKNCGAGYTLLLIFTGICGFFSGIISKAAK